MTMFTPGYQKIQYYCRNVQQYLNYSKKAQRAYLKRSIIIVQYDNTLLNEIPVNSSNSERRLQPR